MYCKPMSLKLTRGLLQPFFLFSFFGLLGGGGPQLCGVGVGTWSSAPRIEHSPLLFSRCTVTKAHFLLPTEPSLCVRPFQLFRPWLSVSTSFPFYNTPSFLCWAVSFIRHLDFDPKGFPL